MDAEDFDQTARLFSARASRRRGIGALLVVLGLAGAAKSDVNAAARKTCKPKCKPCTKCVRGKCKTDRAKNGRSCGRCKACAAGRCVARCGGDCARCANGKPCADRTDCRSAWCNGPSGQNGTCQACDDSIQCGGDANGACECDTTVGGEKVCTKAGGPFTPAGDCAECPVGQACVDFGGGNVTCIPRCGD
jgi:hypothetical protein